MAVKFEVSGRDARVIAKIVVRAASLLGGFERLDLAMDITAAHANGCPLQLSRLLKADDFNFCHDVQGIREHINRKTGKLEDCFLPRFAVPKRQLA